MKAVFSACLLFFLFSCSTSSIQKNSSVASRELVPTIPSPSHLTYQFNREECQEKPCLAVTLKFSIPEGGKIVLRLPDEGSGQPHLERVIHDLVVENTDAKLEDSTEPQTKLLTLKSSGVVRVRYHVIQDFDGEYSNSEHYYRPIIQKTFMHLFLDNILIHPNIHSDSIVEVEFDGTEFKNKERVFTSFGILKDSLFHKGRFGEFKQGVLLIGDYKTEEFKLNGKPVRVALQGKFQIKLHEFSNLLNAVLKTERGFFNDDDFPYFLVSSLSTGDQDGHFGGCGRTQGFNIFAGSGLKSDNDLKFLLFHELFHAWNGHKIHKIQPEEKVYWFSEGFTEYYTLTLALRSGLISLPDYLEEYNRRTVQGYVTSSARNQPVSRVEKDFWNDRDVEKLPYQQGNLLAHLWNDRILKESGGKRSLDDFMRSLFDHAKSSGMMSSAENISQVIRPFLKESVASEISRYIDHGETIPIEPERLGECVNRVEQELTSFDIGFDRAATKANQNIIVGVNEGGPAARAGLKNGMRIRSTDIYTGHPEKQVTIGVEVQGGIKLVSYFPAGKKVKIPQYVLDEKLFKKSPKRCLSYFGVN